MNRVTGGVIWIGGREQGEAGRRGGFAGRTLRSLPPSRGSGAETDTASAAERHRLRRQWAQMIRRIYEVDPLRCVHCGSEMRILSFPPLLLSEGLFCAFGFLIADGYHFEKPVCPLLWTQEPIDLVEQQVVMVHFGWVSVIGIRIPVEVIVRSGEDNATTAGELAVQSDNYFPIFFQ